MFTVLHHAKDGTEAFHSAISVHYHGPFSSRHQTDSAYFLEVVQEDQTFNVIGGMAYVMNAAGATVGKYFLDPAVNAGKLGVGGGVFHPTPTGGDKGKIGVSFGDGVAGNPTL